MTGEFSLFPPSPPPSPKAKSRTVHRLQNLSNLLKTFKHSLQSYTAYPSTSTSAPPFAEFQIKAPRFNLVLTRLTVNTYVLVVLPPGEVDMSGVRLNVCKAKEVLAKASAANAAGSSSGGSGGGGPE